MSEWVDPEMALQLWRDQNWGELFVLITPLIRGVCYRKKFPVLDYEDAVQDACLKVFRRLQDHFDPKLGNIVAYIIQVASHAMYTHCMMQTSQTQMFKTEQMPEWFDAQFDDDDDEAMDDFIRCIRLVQKKVCRKRKVVLEKMISAFLEYGPLNQIEISEKVGMKHSNLNKLMGLIKQKYRKQK